MRKERGSNADIASLCRVVDGAEVHGRVFWIQSLASGPCRRSVRALFARVSVYSLRGGCVVGIAL